HPAAALRAPDVMKQFLEDLANLRDFLGREIGEEEITDIGDGGKSRSCTPSAPAKSDEDGGTLSLF
ncbi:MAG: hypothetical protein KY445_15960, partial [Armatimonadetes bacterium]|nr:hypothetical protein [Armatimonadota bacterium]